MSPVRLQVTVMIAAFVVATISPSAAYETLPPPTTPPMTIPPTTIGACLWEGSQVEGLTPRSRVHVHCMYYECDELGMVMAYPDECGQAPLMCVDSEPGECCPVCPNGKGLEHRAWSLTHSPKLYRLTPTGRQTCNIQLEGERETRTRTRKLQG